MDPCRCSTASQVPKRVQQSEIKTHRFHGLGELLWSLWHWTSSIVTAKWYVQRRRPKTKACLDAVVAHSPRTRSWSSRGCFTTAEQRHTAHTETSIFSLKISFRNSRTHYDVTFSCFHERSRSCMACARYFSSCCATSRLTESTLRHCNAGCIDSI